MLYRSFSPGSEPRKGIVLVAVLVVVTVLALAAYQYSELMNAEFRAADSNTRAAQSHAFALSGVYYTAALLADSDYFTNTLNSNPYDNPAIFQDVLIQDGDTPRKRGHFSIIALRSTDDELAESQPFRFGVEDESAKLNVNGLLQYDKTGSIGLQMLLALPNMTDDVANSLLNWVDPTGAPHAGGAMDDSYSGSTPAYHMKNGPLDSIDEMLLIKGVTSDLLWGNDISRNGQASASVMGGSNGGVDRGWASQLTVYSRDANVDSTGQPRIYINDPTLSSLATNLNVAGISPDLVNFIIAYRLYGGTSTPAPMGGGGASKTPPPSGSDLQAVQAKITADLNKSAQSGGSGMKLTAISSMYSLITATVSVQIGSGRNMKTVSLPSPLRSAGQQASLLPLLLDKCTTSKNADLAPRINVNTASKTVLTTLQGLQPNDVQTIITNQPTYTAEAPPDAIYNTPAWLVTKAGLPPPTVQAIERFITARSTVYRFQAIGYFESGGPVTRLEAVVDTNYGRPRIVYVRDLTGLGQAFDMSQLRK